jgi:type II secretory ATPase GspE/PulE/Tfp pilus assembly ATPase PilB-like protein
MLNFGDAKTKEHFEELRKKEEEDMARTLSVRHGLAYADLGTVPVNMDALRLVDEVTARTALCAPFAVVDRKVKLAVYSPTFPKTLEVVAGLTRKNFEPTLIMVSKASLEKVWARYKDLSFAEESKAGALEISNSDIKKYITQMKSVGDVSNTMEEISHLQRSHRISKIIEAVLAGGFALKASDVHIEPEEEKVRLRYRLDGVLRDVFSFDHETYNLLLSRVKLLSGLKLNVKTEAQDGRFSVELDATEIEIRTSILPGAYNESVVLRILNPEAINVPLEALGMSSDLLEIVDREINRPEGMFLTTGPTGSGKTTTLYAVLRKVYEPTIKIITIEDPIEYHLDGIVQTQVNADKSYTFGLGLRSVLRQDPDVILVGEIRDSETAKTATEAALTGHLVFSTLHTNNAAGTFPRLIELGVDPKTLPSAVRVSMAQRLIRKLCPICRTEKSVTPPQAELISKILTPLAGTKYTSGLQYEKIFEKGSGCDACHDGYKGRIGVFEVVLRSADLERLIVTNASERDIKLLAQKQGIPDMRQDGVIKILQGQTTFEELSRVIDLEDFS